MKRKLSSKAWKRDTYLQVSFQYFIRQIGRLRENHKSTELRFLQKLEDLLFQEQKRKLSEKAWKRSFFIGGQPRLVQSTGLNKPMDMVKVLYQRRPGPGYFLF